jgi:cell fate regulator YaaT (PSP1 superfamily)
MILSNEDQPQTAVTRVAGVRFFDIGKVYHFSCENIPDVMVGDHVIVETTRGTQLGQVMNLLTPGEDSDQRDVKPVLRRATPIDMMSQKVWKAREVEALITCREKAAEIGGFEAAKFVAAQYNFDGTLLTFLFTAEEKLNTNRLRAVLQRGFKARVDLRQVGPRDVAKLLGGMGACGIPRCCSTFLTDFSPISIKMAKAQGISLNPSEITGMCGRLRCCLIYEYEQYVEARKLLPKRNKRVGTPHGEGKVLDVFPLRDGVLVLVEDTQHFVEREEIIPLEEWEALKAKSEAGCAKQEGGACDCGAHAGQAEQAGPVEDGEPEDAGELIHEDERPEDRAQGQADAPQAEAGADDDKPHRSRPKRARRRRPQKPRNDQGQSESHD